jgi:hypothetical protein
MDLISFGQNSFALRYGKYAEDFEYVGTSGSPNFKTTIPVIIAFLCIVVAILFLSKANNSPNEPEKELTVLQKAMRVFGFLLLFAALGGFGFYGYLYFVKYLPEYYEWFDSLPSEAKTELALVSFANKFMNNTNNTQ